MSLDVSVTRDDLYRAYVIEQRSMKEIGHDLGCGVELVAKFLNAFNIEIRSDASLKRCRGKLTKEYLETEYLLNKRSTSDIGLEVGCSYDTVNRALREHGLSVRGQEEVSTADLSGKVFGQWTVLHRADIQNPNGTVKAFLCRCTCGRHRRLSPGTLVSGASTRCTACAANALAKSSIPSTYLMGLKSSAGKRGIPFLVGVEYLESIYEKQGRRCALTGARLNMGEANASMSAMTASVDRIDSMLPYEEGNVQWVHKLVNVMKWNIGQQDFINICHAVAEKHPKTQESILIEGHINVDTDVSDWEIPRWATPKPYSADDARIEVHEPNDEDQDFRG